MKQLVPVYSEGQDLALKYLWCITQLAAAAAHDVFIIIYSSLDDTDHGAKSIKEYCYDVYLDLLFDGFPVDNLKVSPKIALLYDLKITRKLLEKLPTDKVNNTFMKELIENIKQLVYSRNELCHNHLHSLSVSDFVTNITELRKNLENMYVLAGHICENETSTYAYCHIIPQLDALSKTYGSSTNGRLSRVHNSIQVHAKTIGQPTEIQNGRQFTIDKSIQVDGKSLGQPTEIQNGRQCTVDKSIQVDGKSLGQPTENKRSQLCCNRIQTTVDNSIKMNNKNLCQPTEIRESAQGFSVKHPTLDRSIHSDIKNNDHITWVENRNAFRDKFLKALSVDSPRVKVVTPNILERKTYKDLKLETTQVSVAEPLRVFNVNKLKEESNTTTEVQEQKHHNTNLVEFKDSKNREEYITQVQIKTPYINKERYENNWEINKEPVYNIETNKLSHTSEHLDPDSYETDNKEHSPPASATLDTEIKHMIKSVLIIFYYDPTGTRNQLLCWAVLGLVLTVALLAIRVALDILVYTMKILATCIMKFLLTVLEKPQKEVTWRNKFTSVNIGYDKKWYDIPTNTKYLKVQR